MADRIPLRYLHDEFGQPVGLAEYQEGDRVPPALLPPATELGGEAAGTAEALVEALADELAPVLVHIHLTAALGI